MHFFLNLSKKNNPKVIAIDSKNKTKINLTCFLNPKNTKKLLINLISSDVIGMQGHFDGINSEGKLQGWAGSKNTNEDFKSLSKVTSYLKYKKARHSPAFLWWVVRGSNPRPIRCKRIALPAELTTL